MKHVNKKYLKLSKREKQIVDEFAKILQKYKHLGPLELALFCKLAFTAAIIR